MCRGMSSFSSLKPGRRSFPKPTGRTSSCWTRCSRLGGRSLRKHKTFERAQTDLAQAHDGMSRLPLEREAVIQLVATATGKLGALGEQITSLKRRAIGVETRLEEALKGPTTAKRKAEKLPQQDLISPQVLFLHVCWLYPLSVAVVWRQRHRGGCHRSIWCRIDATKGGVDADLTIGNNNHSHY